MKKLLSIFLVIITVFTAMPCMVAASDVITIDVPVEMNLQGATGIDINIRVNPKFVTGAELINPSSVLDDAYYVCNQEEDKVKVAIASASALNLEGVLFNLRLTLNSQATENDELCKIIQVKINEAIYYQAENCILLSGVKDGGVYSEPVTVHFNEGTALLNDMPFNSGETISENGNYILKVTDLNGGVREVSFVINKPENITSEEYPIEDSFVKNIHAETTINDFLGKISPAGCLVYKGEKQVTGETYVGTGMVVKLMDGDIVKDSVTVIVPGDVSGDGKVLSVDYMKTKKAVNSSVLTEAQFKAGDLNHNGVIQSNDYLKIKRHFKGTYNIYDYL